MSVSHLAAFSITGIKIGTAEAATAIHIDENGNPGRIIGEIVLADLDPNQTYSFLMTNPDTGEVETNFQVTLGSGADAGKYFLSLRDHVFDYEGPNNVPTFVLTVTDGNNES